MKRTIKAGFASGTWGPCRAWELGQTTAEAFKGNDEEASLMITEESCSRRRALVDEIVGRVRIDCRGPQMPS